MSYFFTKNNTHMTQLLSELKVPPLEHPIEKSELYDSLKLLHISLDVFASFIRQSDEKILMQYLIIYANKNYNKSKNDNIKFLNIYSQSFDHLYENNFEMKLILCLYNSNHDSVLYTKLYLRYRKIILEYLFCSNVCRNIDKIYLTMKQWTAIISRIFPDDQPVNIIKDITQTIATSKKKELSQNNINSAVLIELCISEYFKLKKKKPEKTFSSAEKDKEKIEVISLSKNNSPSTQSPVENNEIREEFSDKQQIIDLSYHNESQKFEIEDLKATINKLQRDNENLNNKNQILLEFWQVISESYMKLLSYAYRLENSCNNMIELTKMENSPLFHKFEFYKKEQDSTELRIYYMTLQESKEILKTEGIVPENLPNFSEFLKEIGSKSFQEKKLNFSRYDNILQLLELMKSKKLYSEHSFMKEENEGNNSEQYSITSSPLKLTTPAMKHDSLESHEQISEIHESPDNHSESSDDSK